MDKKGIKKILIIMVAFLINLIFVYILYGIVSYELKFDIPFKNMIESYMEKKYGDHNFKVVFYYKDYHHTEFSQVFDFSDKYLDGYFVYVRSDVVPEFTVLIKGTKLEEMTVLESFVKDYYSVKAGINIHDINNALAQMKYWNQVEDKTLGGKIAKEKCEKLKKYLFEKYKSIKDIEIKNTIAYMGIEIPKDLGRIPKLDELEEFTEIQYFSIKIDNEEGKYRIDMEELKDNINKYFNNKKNVTIKKYSNEGFMIYLENKN